MIPRDKIVEFCRRHYIRRLSILGSFLRVNFRSDSNGKSPSLIPGFCVFKADDIVFICQLTQRKNKDGREALHILLSWDKSEFIKKRKNMWGKVRHCQLDGRGRKWFQGVSMH